MRLLRRAPAGDARPIRRNIEMGFYNETGFHPIRRSADYDPRRVESDWTRSHILSPGFAIRRPDGTFRKPADDERFAILKALRPRAYQQQVTLPTEQRPKRRQRSGLSRIERLQAEADALREAVQHDRAGELTDLIRKAGKERGSVNHIPLGTLERLGGRAPKSTTALVTDRFGRKYVKWEYAIDTLADTLGYGSAEDLKAAVEKAQRNKAKLRDLEGEIRDLERSAKRGR